MAAWRGEADVAPLARAAEALSRRARVRNPATPCSRRGGTGARALPSLWLFTDPDRVPDPVAAAARLPGGAGVVLRTFGRPEAERHATPLAALARQRGLVLLVGADAALAARIGAAGVHLPERASSELPRLRMRRPEWIVTTAAHGARALARAAAAGADAVFMSPVFASASPSAGGPLGPVRFARLMRGAALPVYALGGVRADTAMRLMGTGAAGLAAVDALRT